MIDRELIIDLISLKNIKEIDETYKVIINYRCNYFKYKNISLNYDIDNLKEINNLMFQLNNCLFNYNYYYNINEYKFYLYLFNNLNYFVNILLFNKFNSADLDNIFKYIIKNINIDYIYVVFNIKKTNMNVYCNICLYDDEHNLDKDTNFKIITLCNHTFHIICYIKNYIYSINKTCPICRRDLLIKNS